MRTTDGLLAIGCICAALLLAGCSNMQRFDVPQEADGTPSVISIVDRVRCELGNLATPGNKYGAILVEADMIVVIQLNLTVNDDGSLAPAFTYTNGLFSFNAGAKIDAAREQNFTEKLVYSIRSIRNEIVIANHSGQPSPYRCAGPAVYPYLAGDLGLEQSAQMALLSNGLDLAVKGSGTDGAFGGYVQFVVTKNLNAVGPTWTLKHFKGPGSLAGVAETNTDKLIFGFAVRNPVDQYAAGKATDLVNSIQIGQLSTQISTLGSSLR